MFRMDDPGYVEWLAEQEQAQAEEAAYYASAEGEAMAELEAMTAEAAFEEEIRRLLDELAEIQASLDALRLEKERLRESIIPAEVRAALEELEAEFAPKEEEAVRKEQALRKRVVEMVKSLGHTVKGAHLQAVFSMRTSWDSKRLEGFAKAHPEILAFRTQKPSVSIRKR